MDLKDLLLFQTLNLLKRHLMTQKTYFRLV
jgi:hypothetical protein